eukprot:140303-Rhodomonas_salina.1
MDGWMDGWREGGREGGREACCSMRWMARVLIASFSCAHTHSSLSSKGRGSRVEGHCRGSRIIANFSCAHTHSTPTSKVQGVGSLSFSCTACARSSTRNCGPWSRLRGPGCWVYGL